MIRFVTTVSIFGSITFIAKTIIDLKLVMQDIVQNQDPKTESQIIKLTNISSKEKRNIMNRNELITQAILDKLNTGTGIFTAEDILLAANIKEQDLQKLLGQLEGGVAELTQEQKNKKEGTL